MIALQSGGPLELKRPSVPATAPSPTITKRPGCSTQRSIPSSRYRDSGSSLSGSYGSSRGRFARRSSRIACASAAVARRSTVISEEVLVLRLTRNANARTSDAHLGKNRPLGARGDQRLLDALDPDARAGARAPVLVPQRLDREDAVGAGVLAEAEKDHVRSVRHGLIIQYETDAPTRERCQTSLKVSDTCWVSWIAYSTSIGCGGEGTAPGAPLSPPPRPPLKKRG